MVANMAVSKKITLPKYINGQIVEFIGGIGTIIKIFQSSGSWFYFIQMEMGPEPEMGRIGYETTILLSESDLGAAI